MNADEPMVTLSEHRELQERMQNMANHCRELEDKLGARHPQSPKSCEELVITQLRERREMGRRKYGMTMDRDDLSPGQWIQHAQEEAMDLAIYLERVKAFFPNGEAGKCLPSSGGADHLRDITEEITPHFPPVLDSCCGSRMFWFNKSDDRALFVDKRREICHADTREGRREIVVNPDMLADFTALPFADGTFTLVIFDPPHTFAGPNSWTRKKYGTLERDWRAQIKAGFAECFRVLAPLGTLIFKWNEHRVPVSTILELAPAPPLFGQRCGTTARTHWIVFLKDRNHGGQP